LPVSGFGAHIKSNQKKLIVQKKNTLEEYPLDSIKNLLVIGGHTISSSTIVSLVKNGAFISFFEPDGNPVGIIRPFGNRQSPVTGMRLFWHSLQLNPDFSQFNVFRRARTRICSMKASRNFSTLPRTNYNT
jgi:hypothetical protein